MANLRNVTWQVADRRFKIFVLSRFRIDFASMSIYRNIAISLLR